MAHTDPNAPSLMAVLDHHGAKIYRLGAGATAADEHSIEPYDPHGFLHHLTHKDESRERGQRAHEDSGFYEKIAQTLADGGRIVVVGHGTGHSNAAHHLMAYLQAHHHDTHARVVRELSADLSALTPKQLMALGRDALQ